MVDVETVVLELESLGYFKDQKRSGVNLMVTCPFHNGGSERKPSFGIHLETGQCNCFTCGWKGNINSLAEELTGKRHFVAEATKYNKQVKRRPPIRFGGKKVRFIPEAEIKYYTRNNKKSLTYLKNRGILSVTKFPIGYNPQHDSLVLFIRDLAGNYIYTKERALIGKRFYNTENSNRADYLFGLYECGQTGATEVWVCESEIDALTLWQYNIPAVAIGSATISNKQIQQLHQAGIRSIIDGLDRDIAGRQGWLNIQKEYRGLRRNTDWRGINKKDINELTEQELQEILRRLNNA